MFTRPRQTFLLVLPKEAILLSQIVGGWAMKVECFHPQTMRKVSENLKLFKQFLPFPHDPQFAKPIKANTVTYSHTKNCFKAFLMILKTFSAYLCGNQRNTMT